MKLLDGQRRRTKEKKDLLSRLMARNIGEKCKLPLVVHRLRSNWKHASSPARGLGASLPVPVHFRHDWHRCARPKITRSSFNIVSFPFSSKYKFYPNKYLESIIFDRLIPFNQGRGYINQGESLAATIISGKSR